MVSRNNKKLMTKKMINREVPHYSLRKLGIGVVSVLLGTTMYLGTDNMIANADTTMAEDGDNAAGTTATTQNSKIQSNSVALTSAGQATSKEASQQSAAPANVVANQFSSQSAAAKPASAVSAEPSQKAAPISGQSESTSSQPNSAQNQLSASLTLDVKPTVNVNGTNYNLSDDTTSLQFSMTLGKDGKVSAVSTPDSAETDQFDPQNQQLTVKYHFALPSSTDDQQPIQATTNDGMTSVDLNNVIFGPAGITYQFDLSGLSNDHLTSDKISQYLASHISSDNEQDGQIEGNYQVPYKVVGQFIPVDGNGQLLARGVFNNYYSVKDNQVVAAQTVPNIPGYHPKNSTQVTIQDPYSDTKVEYVKNNDNALTLLYVTSNGTVDPTAIELPFTKDSNGEFAQLDLSPLTLAKQIKSKYPDLWSQLQNDTVNAPIAVDEYGNEVDSYDPNKQSGPLYLVESALIGEHSIKVPAGGQAQTQPYSGFYRYTDSGIKNFYAEGYDADSPFYGPKALSYSRTGFILGNSVNATSRVILPSQIDSDDATGVTTPNELLAYAENPDGSRSNRVVGMWNGILSQQTDDTTPYGTISEGFPFVRFTSTDPTFSGKVYPIYLQMTGDGGGDIGFIKLGAEVDPVVRETKTVTRTINYLDSQTHQAIPGVKPVSQPATLYRYQLKNDQGKVIGYRSLDEKTHQYQFSNTWMLDQNKWQQQESPNLTSRGYQKTPHFADGQAAMIVAAGQPDLVAPTDQTINIYYDHATVPVTPDHPEDKAGLRYDDLNKFVTRTINYRDTTGKKVNGAPNGKSTYTQTAHFTRTAIVDKVTGKILGYDTNNDGQVDVTNGDYAWTPLDATFNAVDSKDPASLGYTSVDIKSVGQELVTYLSPAQTITVTYSSVKPEQLENATLHIIDMNENNRDLGTFNTAGKANAAIDFNGAAAAVDAWTHAGYKVHSIVQATADPNAPTEYGTNYPTAAQQWKFDDQPGTDQQFYVYLEHEYTPINPSNSFGRTDLTREVTETVHYLNEATKKPVATDHTSTLTFSGQGMVDLVTGKMLAIKSVKNGQVTYDNDVDHEINITAAKASDFVWSDPLTFAKVVSPTIKGYTIDAAKTTPHSLADRNDIKAITDVTYNHGNVEATVYYQANPAEVHNAKLAIYVNNQLVGTVNASGIGGTPIQFAGAAAIVQAYIANGCTFDHAQDVTNKLTLKGHSYSSVNFGKYAAANHSNQEFAIYLTKAPAKTPQTAKLVIQDVTSKVPVQLGEYTQQGVAGSPISFTAAGSQLAYLLSHGYIWKTATYNDQVLNAKDYRAINFGDYDDQSDVDQEWVIKLVHALKDQQITTKSTAYVHYLMADGSKAPADSSLQTITWTKVDQVDQVTGQTIKDGAWTPSQSAFANVNSPMVSGYTPSLKTVQFATPRQGISQVVNVIYTKDGQTPKPTTEYGTIEVMVHDITTNQDLKNYSKQSGRQKVGTKFSYDTQGTIAKLRQAGYKVLNPTVVVPTTISDGNQQVIIYVAHQIIPVTPLQPGNGLTTADLQKVVKETVTYTGAGDQTPAAKVAKLTFSGSGYYDSVTKKWTDINGRKLKDQSQPLTWVANDGHQFAVVVTPQINGYTSKVEAGYGDSEGNVKAIEGITQNSANIDIIVTYSKAPQPTTPQPTAPQPTTPQPTTPQPTTPQPTTPQPTTPQPTTLQPTVPQPTVPQSSESQPRIDHNQPLTPNELAHWQVPSVPQPETMPSSDRVVRKSQPNATKSTLPQTGNEEATSAVAFGLLGLTLAVGTSAVKKYRKQ